ncbi:MAG: hypothetical protein J6386_10540 [Candidatus Synoicihabitans palmerolidicus]|nr:hypothetical protein [Candidatus Synoicihabitans palmerolidicus]
MELAKPNGGVRLLGIPTVLDRLIQQAIAQQLGPIFDPGFSDIIVMASGLIAAHMTRCAMSQTESSRAAASRWPSTCRSFSMR